MKNLLSIIFISLIIIGCNRDENNERKALSHCADIKYINFINSNPQFIVDLNNFTELIFSNLLTELSELILSNTKISKL